MGPGWPALSPVPPLATSEHVREARDHAIVKRRECKGLFAYVLSLGIVTWTAGCFVQSPGMLLLICQRARGLLVAGRIHVWATLRVGRVRPDSVIFFGENRNSFYFYF